MVAARGQEYKHARVLRRQEIVVPGIICMASNEVNAESPSMRPISAVPIPLHSYASPVVTHSDPVCAVANVLLETCRPSARGYVENMVI